MDERVDEHDWLRGDQWTPEERRAIELASNFAAYNDRLVAEWLTKLLPKQPDSE